jgi:ribonuclease P protein component
VSGRARTFGRLKNRRDFLLAAKGRKLARRAFVLEARARGEGPARFGFTVSKRIARKAVERNRIRRRLKEAVRLLATDAAPPGHDYVLVGRRAALTERFSAMEAELASALRQASGAPATARSCDR